MLVSNHITIWCHNPKALNSNSEPIKTFKEMYTKQMNYMQ